MSLKILDLKREFDETVEEEYSRYTFVPEYVLAKKDILFDASYDMEELGGRGVEVSNREIWEVA
jgi:hypothetical protein